MQIILSKSSSILQFHFRNGVLGGWSHSLFLTISFIIETRLNQRPWHWRVCICYFLLCVCVYLALYSGLEVTRPLIVCYCDLVIVSTCQPVISNHVNFSFCQLVNLPYCLVVFRQQYRT